MQKIFKALLILIININIINVVASPFVMLQTGWQNSQYLQTALRQEKTILDLSYKNIETEDIQAIADTITAPNCKITKLVLSGNSIDNAGAKLIAEALVSPNCKLTELNLNNNNIGNEGAKFIADALASKRCKLTKLDLNNNSIDDAGIQLAEIFAILNSKSTEPDTMPQQDQQEHKTNPQNKFQEQIINGELRLVNQPLSAIDILEVCALQSTKEKPFNKLVLSDCQLQKIPPFPQNYPARIIDLSHNQFDLSQADDFKKLEHLFLLPNLRELDLVNCQLTSIPPFDAQKCHLTVLSLGFNNLDLVTIRLIGSLPQLEIVDFTCCDLHQAPKFNSTRLSELIIDARYLRKSDISMLFKQASLETLTITAGEIEDIDFEPQQCHLKKLNLIYITKLNQEALEKIFAIRSLEELTLVLPSENQQPQEFSIPDLSQHSLQKLVVDFSADTKKIINLQNLFECPTLMVLLLGNCNITTLPNFNPQNSRIQNLRLSCNHQLASGFSQQLTQIKSLTQLDISDCPLAQQDIDTLIQMEHLELVNLTNCGVKKINIFDTSTSKIKQLQIEGNDLDEASFAVIASLPRLVKLNVMQCHLSNLHLAHIFSIPTLEHLEISKDYLQDWGESYGKGGQNIKKIFFDFSFPRDPDVQNQQQQKDPYAFMLNLKILHHHPYMQEQSQELRNAARDQNIQHQDNRVALKYQFANYKVNMAQQMRLNSNKQKLIDRQLAQMTDNTKKTLKAFEKGCQ